MLSSRLVPLQECPVFFPKFASIAAYIRQRGHCRLCNTPVSLSGAWYYNAIPWSDPHWARDYGSGKSALAAFCAMQSSMARAACARCAPETAKQRKGRLRSAAALHGPPELVAFVRTHYAVLNTQVPSLAQQRGWADRLRAETGLAMSTETFISAVWGSMRRTARGGRARQT